MFKLNLKIYGCCSILGSATGCNVLKQHGAAVMKKREDKKQIQYKEELLQEIMNYDKHLAISKVTVLK